jgi:hypothetical protein
MENPFTPNGIEEILIEAAMPVEIIPAFLVVWSHINPCAVLRPLSLLDPGRRFGVENQRRIGTSLSHSLGKAGVGGAVTMLFRLRLFFQRDREATQDLGLWPYLRRAPAHVAWRGNSDRAPLSRGRPCVQTHGVDRPDVDRHNVHSAP